MLRSVASKVAWVGRTASMVFGLALVLALIFGVTSMAFGANGQNFILGKAKNAATKVTGLVGNVDGGAALRVTNPNTGTNDTALDLRVQAGEAPMTVNSDARVANLNAASAGRADSAVSADTATNAQNADTLDGQDSGKLGQMWAVVDSNCTIVRESGASGRASSNFCGVNFERDISNCAFVASISESGAGYPGTDRTGEVWAYTGDGTANGGSKSAVYVRTANSSGARVGLPFHVAVFC